MYGAINFEKGVQFNGSINQRSKDEEKYLFICEYEKKNSPKQLKEIILQPNSNHQKRENIHEIQAFIVKINIFITDCVIHTLIFFAAALLLLIFRLFILSYFVLLLLFFLLSSYMFWFFFALSFSSVLNQLSDQQQVNYCNCI